MKHKMKKGKMEPKSEKEMKKKMVDKDMKSMAKKMGCKMCWHEEARPKEDSGGDEAS